ncbi:hypothetical protein CGRA01v4_02409 [Colletotrichum graminicola]|nr:hypothetical protein CGRA01v4_02409 [Colletotrichum graminicola]
MGSRRAGGLLHGLTIRRLRGISQIRLTGRFSVCGSEASALAAQFFVVVLHGHLEAKLIVLGPRNER